MTDTAFIAAVLLGCVVVSEVLVRRTALRHLGTALVVIIVVAVVANLGVIPSSAGDHPLYAAIFREGASMAIFLLLLRVDLRRVRQAGRSMLVLFGLGAAGTMLGALAGMAILGGRARFPGVHHALGGMYVGTYIGGSPNFIAVATHYEVKDGALLAAANAVDAAMTTIWMAVTLAAPRLLRGPRAALPASAPADPGGVAEDTEPVHAVDLALLLGSAAFVLWLARALEHASAAWTGWRIPAIVTLTTIALAAAQVRAMQRLRGSRLLGMFGMYLFLAVIGALCDLRALVASGATGLALLAFVAILLLVHGTVVFGVARALELDVDVASVASQANIGGGTTALVLARSLGRPDLVLPGILVGSLGTALGTYLGLVVGSLLARL